MVNLNNNQLGSIKVLFLVSGILNILTVGSWVMLTIIGTITTIILGCGAFLVTVIVIAACIFDFINYNRLSQLNRTGTFRSIKIAAWLDIGVIFSLNITSFILGIIILNKLSNPETIQELKEKGIY